ncbi:hypothetical protein [Telmatospirillum sp.]|uniref:hypothetical protein n=1 Tax=Telmatospirillum sp. TaxID=2079197 RepID=UPI0028477A58|nr:hypothetical protein [Telmatospirillum sp.]MDR3434993.1 hypothetical protein [Telmatospirillum sp.]
MIRFMRPLLIVSAFFAGLSVAHAEDSLEAKLEESLGDVVKIGGTGALVGLWLGPLSGRADPTMIRIPGGLPGRSSLCLGAVSQDGAYHAQARIEISGILSAPAKLKPRPDWNYVDDLKKRYAMEQLASVIRRGADCDIDPQASFVPTIYDQADDHFTIMANFPRAFEARAVVSVGQSKSGPPTLCERAQSGTHVEGFNFTCKVNIGALPKGGGDSIVTIAVSDVVGDSNQKFNVWLPAR